MASVHIVYTNLDGKLSRKGELVPFAVADSPETADKIMRAWAKEYGVDMLPAGGTAPYTHYRYTDGVSGDAFACYSKHFVILTSDDIKDGKIR